MAVAVTIERDDGDEVKVVMIIRPNAPLPLEDEWLYLTKEESKEFIRQLQWLLAKFPPDEELIGN